MTSGYRTLVRQELCGAGGEGGEYRKNIYIYMYIKIFFYYLIYHLSENAEQLGASRSS